VSSESEAIRELVRQAVFEALGQPVAITGLVEAPTAEDPAAGRPAPPGEGALPRPGSGAPREYYSPWIGNAYEAHPTQRPLPGLGLPLPIRQEPCPLDNRPCDDCGKCRALGF